MYSIKSGDTLPPIRLTLSDGAGQPIDLTWRTPIVTISAGPGAAPIASREATVIDAAAGTVEFAWREGETARAGTYRVEVVLLDDNGDATTIPGSGYGLIAIEPALRRP